MATVASQTIEGRRQAEQTRLDTLKTAAERNKWGQFATPFQLALSLARYAQKILGKGRFRFLDPAFGTGSFYSALSQAAPARTIEAATASGLIRYLRRLPRISGVRAAFALSTETSRGRNHPRSVLTLSLRIRPMYGIITWK
jgi:hypothetical protein